MIPKILDYEDGRIKVTAEAFAIPEIKAILDKYDNAADPYLTYIHLMTWPESPHINLEGEDRKEQCIYDVTQTVGDFDIDDELLDPAIERLTNLYYSPLALMGLEVDQELHRLRIYLKNSPITSDNVKDRANIMKDIEKIVGSYGKVKEQAEKEIKAKMRGKAQLGDYD